MIPALPWLRGFLFAWSGLALGLALLFRWLRTVFPDADIPQGWPISMGAFLLPNAEGLPFLAGTAGLLAALAIRPEAVRRTHGRVIAWSVLFLISSNGMHGAHTGYVRPIEEPLRIEADGRTEEWNFSYYQDRHRVRDAASFLAEYEKIQPSLYNHSRSHPPGPILLMRAASDLLGNPALITVLMGAAGLILMGLTFPRAWAHFGLPAEHSPLALLILLSLPQVQIYSLYSIDGTICALGCALIATAAIQRGWLAVLAAGGLLFALLMLSFGSVFFLPITILLFWKRWKVGAAAVALAAGLILCLQAFGYDWLNSFAIASRLENPLGPLFLADPLRYAFTRLENIWEPLLFMGPAACLLLLEAFQDAPSAAKKLMMTAIAIVLAMFATGAFRTGETARACLFIAPFLVLGMAGPLVRAASDPRRRPVMVGWIVGFAAFNQAFMFYFW